MENAPLAQMDRALASDARCRRFESAMVRQKKRGSQQGCPSFWANNGADENRLPFSVFAAGKTAVFSRRENGIRRRKQKHHDPRAALPFRRSLVQSPPTKKTAGGGLFVPIAKTIFSEIACLRSIDVLDEGKGIDED